MKARYVQHAGATVGVLRRMSTGWVALVLPSKRLEVTFDSEEQAVAFLIQEFRVR